MFRPISTAALPALLAAGVATGCAASAPSAPETAIKAHDWGRAEAAVTSASGGDALATWLVTYLRLLTHGAPAADIGSFLVGHPDWPDRGTLRIRYDAALASDQDDVAVASLCRTLAPLSASALGRCADAAAGTGDGRAADWARTAWRDGIDQGAREAGAEAGFLSRWGDVLSDEDEWARFELISPPRGGSLAAAARVAERLHGVRRAVAEARVALAGRAPDPMSVFAAVPQAGQDDPALVLLTARALRRDGDLDAALGFWRGRGFRVEAAQGEAMQAADWAERDALARALRDQGRFAEAFQVADDTTNGAATTRADALFLAGWIALDGLHQPKVAAARFSALGELSRSITTRSRAAWWLARAETASGERSAALHQEAVAASFPTTFYGQRALASLEPDESAAAFLNRLRAALRPAAVPRWSAAQALAFASGRWPRAAVMLVAWGEARHAKVFVGEADRLASTPVDHALAASLAASLGLPDEAVAIARRAGREGLVPPISGWPHPVAPPPGLPAPLLLGLMRQESAFDPQAVSPSGALGLMQLLPATASEVARRRGDAFSTVLLTADPALNMNLGADYLSRLMARFDGNVPVAVAAYNAGPHRVATWPPAPMAGPDAGSLDLPDLSAVDWIESIPVAETRNYVERVLENQAVYAALGEAGAG